MFRRFARVAAAATPRARVALATATAFAGVTFSTAASASAAPTVPFTGLPGTDYERTFIAIKPDGVQRGLVGEIIKRFEAKGYKLVAMKMVHPTKEMAAAHYADLSKKAFFPGLVDFFSSGPIVAMVWEGHNAALGGRRLLGTTNPQESAPGSIRGDLCVVTGRNIIHGSDAPQSAVDEITHWFKPEEVVSWRQADDVWVYEGRK